MDSRQEHHQNFNKMRLALVLNDDFSMYHFRGGLIRNLVKQGYEVSVIVPPGPFAGQLESLGARCLIVPMQRFISPLKDLLLIWRLFKVFKSNKFDLVHNMTIKPNIIGTFAAKLAGIPRIVCLVSGIGFIFADNLNASLTLLRWPIFWLYRQALHRSDKTWFQNPDDFEYFVRKRFIPRDKGVVIRSGGINPEEYSPARVTARELEALRDELGIPAEAHCVLMVAARMIWSKGVRQFVEAAAALHEQYPQWYFIMVCPEDPGPDSVPKDYLLANQRDRLIVIDTFRYDIIKFMALADIVVLPSYYREGVPRTLMEGLVMGKPLITTDHPGCREVVDNGRNGYLIPTHNSAALADKLRLLMDNPENRLKFGQHSRWKAENEFSESLVVGRIIRELYEISPAPGQLSPSSFKI